eukprot:TRINITY_DN105352_c3_g1_i1.p1 TRINITY_DN105352_c3_g1~~TRINITY_DN105352_c3_g1_i1.p1  ORF type:complete len:1150 (-),score=111.95 TRINITY_DN105352_c3_g1_i1:28-3477(-)
MALDPGIGLTLPNVQMALQKCLSLNDSERKQAYDYLSECETNSNFPLVLLECFLAHRHTESNIKLQALIYLKNTISRRWNTSTSRHLFKSTTAMTGGAAKFEETKAKVREIVLQLLQETYEPGVEKQIIQILAGIARYDFPAKWETLAQYLLCGLESAKNQILSENTGKEAIIALSPGLQSQLQKFITIYKAVIREQSKKKMQPSKAHFYKFARTFMEATHGLVSLFDSALQRIFNDTFSPSGLALEHFNTNLLKIGYSLDKIVLLVASCGFNPMDLITQSEQNITELRLIQKYIEKLEYYMALIEGVYKYSIEKPDAAESLRVPFLLLCKFVKGIFDRLSEMQYAEPVIMYASLERYLNIAMTFLSVGAQAIFPEELQRACLLCFHRVLNTVVYNEKDIKSLMSCKYTGIVASPVKFRNFEGFMVKARNAFNAFFKPAAVVNLFDLIVSHYLPIKSISLWETDPEAFIEQEDDTFTHEFESDRESSMSYLAYNILEQLLNNFPTVCAKQVKKYVENLASGKMQSYDILLRDAIYNAIEMLPKIYSLKSIGDIPILKAETFLSYLEKEISSTEVPIHSHILKRRYIILITKWLEFIPRTDILGYLGNVVKIMCGTDQLVLKFHCCMAIRKILNFLEGAHLKRKEYDDTDASISKENLPILAELRNIEKQINYAELLTASARIIIDVLNSFTTPKLVWAMVNLLTLLVEKCQYRCNEDVLSVLEATNFATLFSNKYELIQEALIDMCKALVLSFPSSASMLKLAFHIVDTRLSVTFFGFNTPSQENLNNISAYTFWLFILRTATATPEALMIFKQIFMKHAGNLQMVTKEYVLETIFEIVDESLIIDIFTTEEEVAGVVNFGTDAYKKLLNALQQKLQAGAHAADKLTNIMEANAAVVSVLETIFIKYVQPTGTVENAIMIALKPFIEFAIQQVATMTSTTDLQYSSKFNTTLIAIISRLLVYNVSVMITLMQNMGVHLGQFLSGWINKMDFIATHYGRRLNLLAILSIMPYLGAELMQAYMGKLMEYVLPLVENYIYTKEARGEKRSSSASLTPTKPVKHENSILKVKDPIQSDRKAAMREDDVIANIELDTYFYMKYEQMCKSMNLTHSQIRSLIEKDGNLANMLDTIINYAQPVQFILTNLHSFTKV